MARPVVIPRAGQARKIETNVLSALRPAPRPGAEPPGRLCVRSSRTTHHDRRRRMVLRGVAGAHLEVCYRRTAVVRGQKQLQTGLPSRCRERTGAVPRCAPDQRPLCGLATGCCRPKGDFRLTGLSARKRTLVLSRGGRRNRFVSRCPIGLYSTVRLRILPREYFARLVELSHDGHLDAESGQHPSENPRR